MSGVCTSLILLAQYLMITFRRGSILFTRSLVADRRPGVFAMLMAPLMFWFLHAIGEPGIRSAGTRKLLMNRRRLSLHLRIQIVAPL